jgi:cyclopropane fatty-acyl-phospholipid synthase-like methyltransferase
MFACRCRTGKRLCAVRVPCASVTLRPASSGDRLRPATGYHSGMIEKPHAPSTERNREPILAELRQLFADRSRVLEIGSGTGQHAVFFAATLNHLVWQCSDRSGNLHGIRAWLDHAALANTPPPLALDVRHGPWPGQRFDAVFSANTLHIMAWDAAEALFAGLPAVLEDGAKVAIYGPFNRNGAATSEGNAAFDAKLRAEHPDMGLRDAEAIDALAKAAGLSLIADIAMPANNALRVWRLGASR